MAIAPTTLRRSDLPGAPAHGWSIPVKTDPGGARIRAHPIRTRGCIRQTWPARRRRTRGREWRCRLARASSSSSDRAPAGAWRARAWPPRDGARRWCARSWRARARRSRRSGDSRARRAPRRRCGTSEPVPLRGGLLLGGLRHLGLERLDRGAGVPGLLLGEERVALRLELADPGLELRALGGPVRDDALLLLERPAAQLGRELLVTGLREEGAVLFGCVDDVPALVAIGALALELGALERHLRAQLRGGRVGALLPRLGGRAAGAVRHVRVVELRAEPQDLGVLRSGDVLGDVVLIDRHEVRLRQPRRRRPAGLGQSAVDQLYVDIPGLRGRRRLLRRDRSLIELLVARDEHEPERSRIGRPLQRRHRLQDGLAGVLV